MNYILLWRMYCSNEAVGRKVRRPLWREIWQFTWTIISRRSLASKCKSPELLLGLYLGPGNVLLSHGRTTLSSAMTRFTFLFEMGRSGTKSLLSPSYSCALALGFFLRLRCFTPHLLSCKLRRARLILLRIFFSYFGLFSLTRRLELDIHIVFFDLRY